MRDVKLLNGALWGFNGLLGAGILAFAWFFLLPKDANSLKSFRWEDDAVRSPGPDRAGGDDGVLKSLRNPIEKPAGPLGPEGPRAFKATLKGTLASEKDPKNGVAFLKSTTRNVEVVAYVGEEIREGDKASDEYRGWKLVEVSKDQATFSNGVQKETLTLNLEAAAAPGPAGPAAGGLGPKANRIGQAYQGTSFKSQLLASTDSRIVWGLDQDEIEWAVQNQDSIMDQAFQVSPSAAGGIRIDSVQAGSIGAARGVVAGDIIREVNRQPLNSVADVKALMTSQAMRAQAGMSITVERAGKTVVIEYRPLPR